jgi:hypothetical protein
MSRLLCCCAAAARFRRFEISLESKHRLMNRALRVLSAIALLFASIEAEAVTYSFRNIVDSNSIAPSGTTFTGFASPSVSGASVAFEGAYLSGVGIFKGSGGALTTIVKKGDPGEFGPFAFVRGPSISSDNVAFYGAFGDLRQSNGIFVGDGGPLTTIVLGRDPAPVGTFTGFGNPSISGSNVAFFALYREPPSDFFEGVFVGSGGTLTTIAKTGDLAPTGAIRPIQVSEPKINGNTVVFTASDEEGMTGIYTGSGGALAKIVRTGDPAPVGNFVSALLPTISDGAISFRGADGGDGSIFLHKDGMVTTILRASDPAPSGTFDTVWESAVGGSMVAFIASYGGSDEEGIFLSSGGSLASVIKTGDPLFGSSIECFSIATGGSSPDFAFDPDGSGNIAFLYSLSDGRFGVAIARPVPEPSILTLFAQVILAVALRRRSCGKWNRDLQENASR